MSVGSVNTSNPATGSGSAPSGTSASDSSTSATANALNNSLNSISLDQFMKMMIAELQNQDPLNPTDSSQILGEISQMSQISSTQQLSSTLNGVLLGQNLSAATSLIGKTIQGLDPSGNAVNGVVSSVSIANGGTPTLAVGNDTVTLSNVSAVLASGSGTSNTSGSN